MCPLRLAAPCLYQPIFLHDFQIENRAYFSRAFRKLHIEVAARQDGLEVRRRQPFKAHCSSSDSPLI